MVVRRRLLAWLCAVVVLSSFVPARQVHAATIRQVPGTYPTIAAGLAAASAGDTVLVAPGTYVENVVVPDQVTLTSSGGPSVTTIDGGRADTVAVINSGATVHGFTLRNGGATDSYVGGAKVYGTLDGNILTGNGACYRASAVWLIGGTASNNTFHDNQGWCSPLPTIDGSGSVLNNDIDEDGYVFYLNAVSPTIDGNVFRGNAYVMSLINDAHPLVRNNLFLSSSPTLMDWLVPSGAPGPTIVNNTFITTAPFAQLIHASGFDSSAVIANNVLVAPAGGTFLYCDPTYDATGPSIQGNDFWRPGGGGLVGDCANAIGTNGNVAVDPVFVSAPQGDYHLRADSPLIDAGVNGLAMASDIDGDARPFDGDENGTATVDPGFDESDEPLAVMPGDVAFGDVAVSRTSTTNVVLKNFGSSTLTVTSAAVTGTGAADYSIAGQTCSGATLAVGASCTIPVAFTPSAIADRDATLTVAGPGAVGTRQVPLSGAGIDPIVLTPPSFSLGDVTVGDAATPGTVTVTYHGGPPATITSVTTLGDSGDVKIGAETCTAAPIATDGTCSIPFTWRPRAAGDRSTLIVIVGSGPAGIHAVTVSGHASPPPSGVTWGTMYTAGPANTWNGGSALARTVEAGTQHLHALYATDRIGGTWATDNGPKVGIYYIRSTTGSSWSTPLRLNPTTEHATIMGLAASGSKVYTMWVSQTKYVHYAPTAPRVLYVRVNTNHGSASAWRSRIRLTSTSGRVDYPVIAASGNDAHIAYTDSVTGSIHVRSSRDGGATWSDASVGTTSIDFTDGKTGFPTIAVDGATVAVCWLTHTAGSVRCRISANRGASWGTALTVGVGSTGYIAVAVEGSRVAVAWPTVTNVVVRQRIGGVWKRARAIETAYHYQPYGLSVLLRDTDRIRVSWSERQGPGEDFAFVFSAESTDGGITYYAWETAGQAGNDHWSNDWPSMIWPSDGTRYVLWNGWRSDTPDYRLYVRRGLGTPVGTLSTTLVWRTGTPRPGVGSASLVSSRAPSGPATRHTARPTRRFGRIAAR